MTVVPIRLHRRTQAAPTNHGATYCHMCWTRPGDQHTGWCPETAHSRRPRLAHPEDARVFRGLIYAVLLSLPVYLPLIIAALIWSNS